MGESSSAAPRPSTVVIAAPSTAASGRRHDRRGSPSTRTVRVFFAEWIDPPFCAGHWLPEMIELAGGADVLGRSGRSSYATTWEEVLGLEPELVVIGPCGFGVEEAAARAADLELPCAAVSVDGDA